MKISVRILSCCFLVFIFVFSVVNVRLLFETLEKHPQADLTELRDSLQQAYVSDRLQHKNDFLNLNGLYARISGRRVHNDTVIMKNGMLAAKTYTVSNMEDEAKSIALFDSWLSSREIPFLYVQMPYKLDLEGTLLPTGVENIANDTASELVQLLNSFGVNTLDLRTTQSATPEMIKQTFYQTDHHWTPLGAFEGFRQTVQELQRLLPEENLLSAQGLALDNWNIHTKEKQFLGSYGKRVGKWFGGVDDLIWLTPSFDTQLSMYIPKFRQFVRGSFEDVLIQDKYIDDDASLFELNHYCVYIGGDFPLVHQRNETAEVDKKLLIFKDSFTLPYQSFFSTIFTEVDVVDPRHYNSETLTQYIETTQPDVVVLAINPSVLGMKNYFRYPIPEETVEEITEVFRHDVSFVAKDDNKYQYKTVNVDLKPGVRYRVSAEAIQVETGSTDGVFLAVYDSSTKTFYDSIAWDLAYCESVGEYTWTFRAPSNEKVQAKLLIYSGLHGQTNGVAVTYKDLVLEELN